MTDLRQAAQMALEALEGWEHCDKWVWPATALEQAKRNTTESFAALRTALEQQAEPVYKDSAPHLHVGDSAFESWFQAQPFATQTGIKQISRDSYAAGMGDPLVVADSQQQAEPVHGDIRALKYRIHELEGEVMGYKRMLDVAEAAPQRNPLTDEEIDQLLPEIVSGGSFTVVTYGRAVARAIEAKLKEKNSD